MEPKELIQLVEMLEEENENKGNIYYWEDLGESFADTKKYNILWDLLKRAKSSGYIKFEKPSSNFFYFNNFTDDAESKEEVEKLKLHAWSWTTEAKNVSCQQKIRLPK